MVYTGSLLLLLSPLTPLHAGTGRSGGIVDLPVQRDNLGFPIIYASSLKGALKTHVFLRRNSNEAKILFGPEPEDSGEKYASPVSITDAFPLLIPARSAKSSLVMITSGFMAKRVLDLIELALASGAKNEDGRIDKMKRVLENIVEASREAGVEKAVAFSKEPVLEFNGKSKIVVCGEMLSVALMENLVGREEDWSCIKQALPQAFQDAIPRRIVVLSEDDALRVIEKSMIRLTRVRLERDKKVVKTGGLWTEEYLPHGSLLVSVLLYSKYRAEASGLSVESDDKLREKVVNAIGIRNTCGYLVFGGKESIGKGITRVCLY